MLIHPPIRRLLNAFTSERTKAVERSVIFETAIVNSYSYWSLIDKGMVVIFARHHAARLHSDKLKLLVSV